MPSVSRLAGLARALPILLTLTPLAAQSNPGNKPKPGGKPAAKAGAEQPLARKDDPVTAKDPVVIALDKLIAKRPPAKKQPDWRQRLSEPPVQTFAPERTYYWHLVTSHGEIKAKLRPDVAPLHVTNVIYLTRMGFYDGLGFHRVIQGFMAQGGCPLGNGNGNPGYQLGLEVSDQAKHDKPGILSTANEGKDRPKSDGSQFFITFAPTPHLDGAYTLFGEVVSGMEAVKAMEERGGTAEASTPKEPLTIAQAFVTVEVAADAAASAAKTPAKAATKPPTKPPAKTGGAP